ncbi:hypothetical protein X740_27990 [Mesorhizobium sp. LNHC221B00]|uniref:hypothetical protein n=1 Tax=Mesorhizobium sp. LNHC221B00 TaxID=1287233 RepID=UPI0003CEA892|nr:hypothetical protein [Mesorhizobium sp. LNHC221B00]ESY76629.1 hypothetical protein X740_27990 [Mesorhizobium sp. LNHC221B00]
MREKLSDVEASAGKTSWLRFDRHGAVDQRRVRRRRGYERSLASFTFEPMEIASYTILITGSNAAGEGEIARVCKQYLRKRASHGRMAEGPFRKSPRPF